MIYENLISKHRNIDYILIKIDYSKKGRTKILVYYLLFNI